MGRREQEREKSKSVAEEDSATFGHPALEAGLLAEVNARRELEE